MQPAIEFEPDRSRARIDPRWRQDGIARSRLLIVGGGYASQLAAVAAAGLGFAQVALVDTMGQRGPGVPRLWVDNEMLRSFSRARYPDVCLPVLSAAAPPEFLSETLRNPDACIVFCGADGPLPEQITVLEALVEPSRHILACVGDAGVSVSITRRPLPLASNRPATLESSLLAAGLALSEARRLAAPCEEDCEPECETTFELPCVETRLPEIRMAGAGGTGSWLGLAAYAMSDSLFIWDADAVEVSNLARCPLLSRVGANKASSLAQSLASLRIGATRLEPVASHAGGGWLGMADPGAVAAFCTDSLASRRVLNSSACESGVPAVNLGTSLWGASVYTVTSESACMECRFPDLDERIEIEKNVETVSCGRRLEASGSISNLVAAGAAGLIARRLRVPGFAFPGVLHFDAFSPTRLWVDSVREPCRCHGGRKGGDCDGTA